MSGELKVSDRLLAALRTAIREVYEQGMDPPEAAVYVRDVLKLDAGFAIVGTTNPFSPTFRDPRPATFAAPTIDFEAVMRQSFEDGRAVGRRERTVNPEGLDALLPTFEVGQGVGELQPGRHRHDWCSIHGDIGPDESIDAHARRAHGSGAEAIRKARKVLKRAARLSTPQESKNG